MTGNKAKTEAEARPWRTAGHRGLNPGGNQDPGRADMAKLKSQIDHSSGPVKGKGGPREKEKSCNDPKERR